MTKKIQKSVAKEIEQVFGLKTNNKTSGFELTSLKVTVNVIRH